jgi:hypothetical protein
VLGSICLAYFSICGCTVSNIVCLFFVIKIQVMLSLLGCIITFTVGHWQFYILLFCEQFFGAIQAAEVLEEDFVRV